MDKEEILTEELGKEEPWADHTGGNEPNRLAGREAVSGKGGGRSKQNIIHYHIQSQ